MGPFISSGTVAVKPVCLVTGAGGRLGSVLCRELLDSYDIIAVYRSRMPPANSQLRQQIASPVDADREPGRQPRVYAVEADLTHPDDMRRVVEVGLARCGRIDAVINAAADTKFYGRLTEIWDDPDYAQKQMLLNCIIPQHLVSAIFLNSWKHEPHENAKWNRSVINVSSVSALQVSANRGQAFYAASKAALNILTMYLSLELAPYSVRANAICPSRFMEPLTTARVAQEIRELLKSASTGLVVT